MTEQEYLKLCAQIWEHNKKYYIEHSPTISDEEFDHLLKKLEQVEKEHPEWISPDSPSQRVGEGLITGFKTLKHKVPMLSIANVYSLDELREFIKRMHKLTGLERCVFSCELKMDGVAISARYENGAFFSGVTRGDGKQGDDVTANMKTIQALPLRLTGPSIPDVLEIRGEVFMPVSAFLKLNEEKEKEGLPLFANPRNAASGSLKLLDSKETAKRKLAVVFYAIAEISGEPLTSQYETHHLMQKFGLPTLEHVKKCESIECVEKFLNEIASIRESLPYHIDGVVIKLDDLKEAHRIGNTGKNPRWAVAYKFAAQQAKTIIKAITVQIGRTGVCTPVAELEPVFIAGSTIARASLYNEEEVQRKDIRVGDVVTVEKGGDVIPKVVEVDLSSRSSSSAKWVMPTHCPSCGSELVRIPGAVAVRCPNYLKCKEQQHRKMIHFASKEAMNIENLGEKVILQLLERGLVSTPSDLYLLGENELSQLDGFKQKAIERLQASLEKSKKVSLPRFIMAMGIPHVGIGVAELLAEKSGDIKNLLEMKEEELLAIDGIGEKTAKAIAEFFSDPENRQEIDRLLSRGIELQKVQKTTFTDHPFSGKTFVLTGTLKAYTRSEVSELIKERGGKVANSVSKTTDFLLAGDDPGSKKDKAESLGVKILSEEEFDRLKNKD